MKTAHRRLAFLICTALTSVWPLSGCTVGGKSFSMDSNSRIPFFGLELRERKPKSSVPSYNSISRSAAIPLRIETAVGVGPSVGSPKAVDLSSKPVDLMPKDPMNVAISRASAANTVSGSGTGSTQSGKGVQRQTIPLPRTDNDPGTEERPKDRLIVDFQ